MDTGGDDSPDIPTVGADLSEQQSGAGLTDAEFETLDGNPEQSRPVEVHGSADLPTLGDKGLVDSVLQQFDRNQTTGFNPQRLNEELRGFLPDPNVDASPDS